ncbi:MAG: TIGR04133 family radical SAM/SPASM protein [Bacteroidales bacterium]|nr:TIGR04133 family radical SAM/SPASM protein [Bacteroidales bacterium]
MMSFPSLKQRITLNLNSSFIKEEAKEHPLMQLFWECTLRCNMKCRHCGSDCKVSTLHPDMPFGDFEKVLLRIKEKYDSHKILIILSGGEPLVREDIVNCARRIYELEFPWGMVSNGRLMSPGRIEQLLRAGMRSATISLDGLEEDHNWMRGVPDAFSYASQAIKILAAESSIAFDVVTCVNRRNFPSLNEIKEYLISLGLKYWRIFTVFPVGRAATDPELQISDEQYRALMDFIVATRKEGRIHLSYGCEGFLGPYEGKVRDHLFSCQAGLSIASVRIDGAISGCNSIRSHYDQGNIYTDDFIDVWENRFGIYRDHSPFRTRECADCKWWKWCLGNGMHLRDEQGRLILCNLKRLQSG